MEDILLSYSDIESVERMFEGVRNICLFGNYKLLLEQIQRGQDINFLGYKLCLEKNRIYKEQIRRDLLQTLKDLQRLLGHISNLQHTFEIPPALIISLFITYMITKTYIVLPN